MPQRLFSGAERAKLIFEGAISIAASSEVDPSVIVDGEGVSGWAGACVIAAAALLEASEEVVEATESGRVSRHA